MKEETLNELIEEINNALWHLKNDKCNVDTKEKGWETYCGLDNELIGYIRKIEKTNVDLQSKIDKAIDYLYKNSQYNDGDGIHYIKEDEYCVDYLLDILKGEDK